jgi:hypothetical protein
MTSARVDTFDGWCETEGGARSGPHQRWRTESSSDAFKRWQLLERSP